MDHRPSRFVAGGRFGEPDVEWHVDAGEDPNEIGAAVLHHLLVRRLFELHPGRLAAARLAIYTDGSERTASRLLRGDTEVSLSDLIGWIGVAGAELLRDLPFDLRALLPDRAPPLSDDWQPGEWRRPRFAELGGLLDLNWTAVADGSNGLPRYRGSGRPSTTAYPGGPAPRRVGGSDRGGTSTRCRVS